MLIIALAKLALYSGEKLTKNYYYPLFSALVAYSLFSVVKLSLEQAFF